jgi:hypothetical protein
MNAYWKHNLKYSKKLHLPKLVNPIQDLNALTSGILEKNNNKIRIGRSWKADELRLKSDSDLHKLWYVLVKERLAIKSDQYRNSQDISIARNDTILKNCLLKVQVSMTRLRTVMGERSTIRNEFMTFLEFYYIRMRQINPEYVLLNDKNKQEPLKTEVKETETKEEMKVENQIEKEKKGRVIRGAISTYKNDTNEESENKDKVSVLDEKEKLMVEKLKKKYKSNELLKEYVQNAHLLQPKQKRQVKGIIDATRANQAKKIFMKEMAAISYKFKSLEQSNDPNIRKLENLS